ncbi:hypothetical protein [Pontibaca methylaminivorans]|uniref:hypothetical protein n=1 Tax=Pontibaca methylaminivorans TaxID=515897 RepID=UPI00117C9277|nr:hypothetical protein [Pontibaca methylaminivorans]
MFIVESPQPVFRPVGAAVSAAQVETGPNPARIPPRGPGIGGIFRAAVPLSLDLFAPAYDITALSQQAKVTDAPPFGIPFHALQRPADV